MNNSDYLNVYNNLCIKYNLKIITLSTDVRMTEIDSFIENLNKEFGVNGGGVKIISGKDYSKDKLINTQVYVSKALIMFLNSSNIFMDSRMFYNNLFSQITSIIDTFNSKKIKNINTEIFNDLRNIVNTNINLRKQPIHNFISKYTSLNKYININM